MKVTLVMEAGITDHVWALADLIFLVQ